MQQPDDKRVEFQLADDLVVSSSDSDDEAPTCLSQVSRTRLVYSSDGDVDTDTDSGSPPKASECRVYVISSDDDDDAGSPPKSSEHHVYVICSDDDADARSPPKASERRVDVSSSDDAAGSPPKVSECQVISSDDDAGAIGCVAQLSEVRETTGTLPRICIREEDVDREGGGTAERASSSSLTIADVIRNRNESIDRQRSLIEEIPSRYRSSSDESSRKRSFRRTPAVTPRNRSRAGRQSRRERWSRDARATPFPTSSVEEPLRVPERGQTPPVCSFSSASSSTSSIGEPPAKTSRVRHSTPYDPPRRRFASLRDNRATGSAPLRGTLAVAASADRPLRTGREFFQVLDRGQMLVITKEPELQEVTYFGEQPPTEPPSAAPSPASRLHDQSSDTRRSDDAVEWSTVMRFGVGDNRERVLLSDAPSALSAIASFGAQSRTSQAPQDLRHEQREPTPAACDDLSPATLLKQLLKHCQQEDPVTFEDALRLTSDCRRCVKLGEGCTADVYRVRMPNGDESAVKVMPVGGGPNEDGELPMSFSSVILECVMTRELSNLRLNEKNRSANFIELKRMYCVKGTYHPVLMQSWTDYNSLFCSENSNPALLGETQCYVLLEFEFGGKSLERTEITIQQLESVFLQVACSLAVAELQLEFEHRDLHCDNVLVNTTEQEFVEFMLRGRKIQVRTAGVKASIIDYTLSRTRIGEQVCFTDLSKDAALFQRTGSSQYDIYRTMKEQNGDDWEAYRPHTNVLWLRYLLMKLLQKLPKAKQVADVVAPSTSCGRLAAWMDMILSFSSAEEFVAEQVIPHLERDTEVCATAPD